MARRMMVTVTPEQHTAICAQLKENGFAQGSRGWDIAYQAQVRFVGDKRYAKQFGAAVKGGLEMAERRAEARNAREA